MVKRFQVVLVLLVFASGCGAGGSPPPRQPEGEFERLHGSDLARARELYAAGEPEEAGAILRALAADENWEVRAHAISAAGRAKDRNLLPEVHAALTDENIEVREAAGRALQSIGDASSIGPLLGALSDPEPVIRLRAVEGLALFGGASEIETLEKVSKDDPDPDVRSAARDAVASIQSASGP